MIAVLVTLAGLFFIYVKSDDTVTVIVCVVVIALVWFLHICSMDEARARVNWENYWSSSGKDRVRMRRKWEAEADAEEARIAENERKRKDRELQEARRKADRSIAERQAANKASEPVTDTTRCEGCGKAARVIRTVTYPNGAKYVEYQCPFCGERKLKKA